MKKTVYSGTRFTTQLGTNPVPGGSINQPIKGNAKMLGTMVNAWYDIETGSAWSPFIGGGIGVFNADFSGLKWDPNTVCQGIASGLDPPLTLPPNCGLRPKDKDTVFAYQVGGGVGYRVDDTTTVQLSYKYQLAPGLQFDGKGVAGTVKTKSDMKIHLFEVGFRYHF